MALAIFACSFVIFAGLSAHGLPVQDEWPEDCKNYYYCWNKTASYPDMDFKRLLKGENLTSLDNGNIDDRIGDIADCHVRTQYKKIYMIKDLDNTIWYVAQTDYFQVIIATEECRQVYRNVDRVMKSLKRPNNHPLPDIAKPEGCMIIRAILNEARISKAGNLEPQELKKNQVYCRERRVDFVFPVLSRNRTTLETRSPHNGIPVSCSAKIMQN